MGDYVPADLRRLVRSHFLNCCAYCKSSESLAVATFEIEHILHRSQGGPTAFKNLCLACPSCNRHKSNRTVGLTNHGIETRLFHPQLDVWQNHFEWSVDGTLIVAITDIGNATIHSLKMNRPQLISLRALWVIVGKHPPDRA